MYHAGGLATGNVSPPWDYFIYWPFFQGYAAAAVLAVSLALSIWLGLRGRKRRNDSRILVAPINLALIAVIAGAYLYGPFIYP